MVKITDRMIERATDVLIEETGLTQTQATAVAVRVLNNALNSKDRVVTLRERL